MTNLKKIFEINTSIREDESVFTSESRADSRSYDDTIDQYYLIDGEGKKYKAIYDDKTNIITTK